MIDAIELIRALVLGIVQGATEFIPVSSSGHLVLVPELLGWPHNGLLFDTVLHWGTLLALVIFFWQELWAIVVATLASLVRRSLADPMARLGWLIVVGTIPAVVLGLLFKDTLEGLFASPRFAALFLLVTAGLLSLSEWLGRGRLVRTLQDLGWSDGILIGLAQSVALLPGISRSGATMAAGLARGVRREDAARFSFLLGMPAFLGAGLLQLADTLATDPAGLDHQLPVLAVGFLASAVSGFLAIRFLLNYLRRHSLYLFAAYCALAGGLAFLWLSLGG